VWGRGKRTIHTKYNRINNNSKNFREKITARGEGEAPQTTLVAA